MLEFQNIDFSMKEMIDSYTFKYGEDSCQHSFVSSYYLLKKYADMFCEHDNFLYTLRSKRCSEGERVYLFPLGNSENIQAALENIFEDAHSHGCRVKFETLNERAKQIVTDLYPGRFTIEENRNYSEYIYSVEKWTTLEGSEFSNKRNKISRFCRNYRGRWKIEKMAPKHFDEILDFQEKWLQQKISINPDPSIIEHLLVEDDILKSVALKNFDRLELRGIVLFIDDKIKGYAYGVPLSEDCVDEFLEKGDRDIPDISKVLFHEFAKNCCIGYKYLNKEEDLGITGLRRSKLRFRPEFLIDKFIVTENLD